jgi:hypothetical protein
MHMMFSKHKSFGTLWIGGQKVLIRENFKNLFEYDEKIIDDIYII